MNYVHLDIKQGNFTGRYGDDEEYGGHFYRSSSVSCDSMNYSLKNNKLCPEFGSIRIPTKCLHKDFGLSIPLKNRRFDVIIYLDGTHEILFSGLAILQNMSEDFSIMKIEDEEEETDLLDVGINEDTGEEYDRPLALGFVSHFEPILINAGELKYDCGGEAVEAYDGGVGGGVLIDGRATNIPFRRNNDNTFCLLGRPVKKITCDVNGTYGNSWGERTFHDDFETIDFTLTPGGWKVTDGEDEIGIDDEGGSVISDLGGSRTATNDIFYIGDDGYLMGIDSDTLFGVLLKAYEFLYLFAERGMTLMSGPTDDKNMALTVTKSMIMIDSHHFQPSDDYYTGQIDNDSIGDPVMTMTQDSIFLWKKVYYYVDGKWCQLDRCLDSTGGTDYCDELKNRLDELEQKIQCNQTVWNPEHVNCTVWGYS